MNPLDALESAFLYSLVSSRNRPGEVIEVCSKEVREALQHLKSDDIAKIRFEPWMAP